jgi:FkbM family methyltransferase
MQICETLGMSNNYDWCLEFLPTSVGSIVEVGGRDALDAIRLSEYFQCTVVSFEPNPDQFAICSDNLSNSGNKFVELRPEALSNENSLIDFFAVDASKYENTGASSFFEIDFSNRGKEDPDSNRTSIQIPIKIQAMRWDSLALTSPELLVMDCEGAELLVLEGFGQTLQDVHYVVLEVSQVAIGSGACTFREVNSFLKGNNFKFFASSLYGKSYHQLRYRLLLTSIKNRLKKPIGKPLKGRSFDVLYENLMG